MTKRLVLFGLLAAFATGSALAQTVGFASFTAPLSPSSENPPVTGVAINGTAVVLVQTTRNTSGDLVQAVVDFHIDFNTEAPQTIFAMHIHRGAQGVNGPVVIDSVFGPAIDFAPGSHRIFRQNIVTSSEGLAVVEALLASPARYYVNLHSNTFRGGIIRGQLEPSNASQFSALRDQIEELQEANGALSEELADVKETLGRIARRLGVVPKE